jgi:hypothetical protein
VIGDKGGAFAWRRKELRTPLRFNRTTEVRLPAAGLLALLKSLRQKGRGMVAEKGDPISRRQVSRLTWRRTHTLLDPATLPIEGTSGWPRPYPRCGKMHLPSSGRSWPGLPHLLGHWTPVARCRQLNLQGHKFEIAVERCARPRRATPRHNPISSRRRSCPSRLFAARTSSP